MCAFLLGAVCGMIGLVVLFGVVAWFMSGEDVRVMR